jgi:hypothetical protein
MWYERRTEDEFSKEFIRCSVCKQNIKIGRHPEGGEYEPPLPIASASFMVRANGAINLAGTSTALSDGSDAPVNSPTEVNLELVAGKKIAITVYGNFGSATNLDGTTSNIVTKTAENSIGGLIAPNYSLCGVFLTDNAASGTAPATLDYTLAATRNYTSLAPAIAQPFYIGEGEYASSSVVYYRYVTVPVTATRLFLANHIATGWMTMSGFVRGSAFMASNFGQVDKFVCGKEGHASVILKDRAAGQGCPFCGSPAWRSGGKAGDLKRGW